MKNYQDVQMIEVPSIKVGNELLDNLFSAQGGIEWGNLIFLTGTSGAGKTTFCKKLQSLISDHKSVFYSREMLSSLVKKQTLRLEINHKNAFIADSKDYSHFSDFMSQVESDETIKIIIIDSIQHVAADLVETEGLSLEAAMRSVYKRLMNWKNNNNGIVILIGQVTKEGDFQGANFLKHDADAHVHMVFDRKNNIRTIETTKNRMGKLGKLYYEIVDSAETLIFSLEKNNNSIVEENDFVGYLFAGIEYVLKSIDVRDENYLDFVSEYNVLTKEVIKKHEAGEVSDNEYCVKIINIINELRGKYGV